MKFRLSVIALAVVVALAAPAGALNLVSNPGFEEGTGQTMDYWDEVYGMFDPNDAHQSTAVVNSGSYAAHIGSSSPEWPGFTNYIEQEIPVASGEDYTFSVYLASDSNAPITDGAFYPPVQVEIQYIQKVPSGGIYNLTEHTEDLYQANFAATDTYYQFSVTGTADPNANYARIRIDITGGIPYPVPPNLPKEFIYADDAYVESAFTETPHTGPIQISKGNQILLDNGLQISASVAYPFYNPVTGQQDSTAAFNWAQFADGYFTQINDSVADMSAPAGQNWGMTRGDDTTTLGAGDQPYKDDMVSLQWRDEQWLGEVAWRDQAAAWFAGARASGDFDNTILYTNQYGKATSHWYGAGNRGYGGSEDEHLRAYMRTSQPDMLYFDYYPTKTASGDPPLALARGFYGTLSRYRKLSLEGNDGTGETPIPFGLYLQSFTDTYWPGAPSESEVRLQQFAAWAYGAKHATHFMYTSFDPNWGTDLHTTLFDWNGESDPTSYTDVNPTTAFDWTAEANRRSLNLGDSLVRLITSDVRVIQGQYKDASDITQTTPLANENAAWDASADPYITAITATNLGTENYGLPGEVLVGYYGVMDESFDGDAEGELYFMLVNALSTPTGSVLDCRQSIHLEFDMGASGITQLLRLNSDTGLLETLPLVHDGGSLYHLDLILDGGTGDLFKFDTGADFVGAPIPEPATVALLGLGALSLLRRRCRG